MCVGTDDQVIRIFLSSPGDVAPEREAAARVVSSLNAARAEGAKLEIIRWEESYYTADSGFQDQIAPTSDCDLVICIFWKSLGSELPERYRRSDGALPTGTEYEFETALERSLNGPDQLPDVLVYRKDAEITYRAATVDLERAQLARFQSFWARWFRNEQGHFVAGFHAFEDTAAFEAQLRDHLTQWLNRRQGEVEWTGGSPFRGLKPFHLEHAPVFFGRAREVSRLRARFLANALRGARFMAVVGPSGSGKSSLLRAGLLPNLLQTVSTPDLPSFAHHAILRPSDIAGDWATGLADALFAPEALGKTLATGDSGTPERLAAVLRDAPAAAAPALQAALDRASDGGAPHAMLLLVDQLEEVFVWPDKEQAAFGALIETLCSNAEVYVIASMRAEFGDRLAALAPFSRLAEVEAVSGASSPIIAVTTPSAADLREVINGPARVAGLSFEADLVEQIEAEAEAAPDALPALQYLLQKLYEARDGTVLTKAGFEAMGGVGQVMASQGDAALAPLGAEVSDRFEALVRRLVILREASGNPVSRPLKTSDLGVEEAEVTQALVDAGLLIRDAHTTRIAHEALITDWKRFADVIALDRRLLETRYRLGLMARAHGEMTDQKEARSALLTGFSLSEAHDLQQAWTPAEIGAEEPLLPNFITASSNANRTARRRRLGSILAACAVVMAAAGALFWQQQRAGELALLAELQSSTAKAANASLRSGDWPVAVAEARRARSLVQNADTLSLALSVTLGADSEQLVEIREGDHLDIGFTSNDGLYTLAGGGLVLVEDREKAVPPLPDGSGAFNRVLPLSTGGLLAATRTEVFHVSSDGAHVVSLGLGTHGPFFDVELVEAKGRIHAAINHSLQPSGGGATIRAVSCALPFDPETCGIRDVLDRPEGNQVVTAIALSPDGEELAFGTSTGTAEIMLSRVSTFGRTPPQPSGRVPLLERLSYAADGKTVLALTRRPNLQPNPNEMKLYSVGPAAAAISLEKFEIVLGQQDAERNRTSVSSPIPVWAPGLDSRFLAASSASDHLAYGCFRNLICLRKPDGTILRFGPQARPATQIAISPNGSFVAARFVGGEVRLWDAGTGTTVAGPLAKQLNGPVRGLAVGDSLFAVDDIQDAFEWPALEQDAQHLLARDTGGTVVVPAAAGAGHATAVGPARFAAVRSGNSVRTYDFLSGAWEDEEHPFPIVRVAPAPDGGILAAGLQGVSTTNGVIPAPDGLRVGGVTSHGEAIYFSTTDGGLWRHHDGNTMRAVPKAASADEQAGLSLDVHPSGRFIAVTRSDRKVLVHDLEQEHPPVALGIPTDDSRVVAFSPDGGHVAVLTSAGQMGVWRFDADTAQAEAHVFVDPIPPALVPAKNGPATRMANWLDWVDEHRIAVASETGDVIVISTRPEEIEERLDRLHRLYTTGRAD